MYIFLVALLAVASARSPFGKPKRPEDCVAKFGPWTACTVPCGAGGTQQRLGEIVVHAKYGGEPCGPLLEKRLCLGNPECAPPEVVHCQVWFGEWSECSKHCGGGFQWRRGVIEKEAKNGGNPCPSLEQEQACNPNECSEPEQDCKVYYNNWSGCSTSCGPGFQWRRATILQRPKNGGAHCPPLEQEQACNQDIQCTEPDVDCEVVYGQWGPCSKPCGGGFQWRRGTVTVARQGNGNGCPELEQEQACSNHACTTAPIDCQVRYSDYSDCSQPCGGGVKRRWGKVLIQPENGGAPCPLLEEQLPCNDHLCTVPAVDCKVVWSEYSDCSLPCGGGTKKRWGRVVQRPSNGGVPCPVLEQETECNIQPCLIPIDCKLWFPEWSSCSASCGGGVKRRRGLIEIAPENGGGKCPPIEQTVSCNGHECDERFRDCKVSFATWSECSQPCGGGFQWRRGAIVEQPVGGGKPCPPARDLEQEQACNTFECDPVLPKDCRVKYSEWGPCNKPCGGGTQQRWGKIVTRNEHGGSPCPPLEEDRVCNEHLCDIPVVNCLVKFSGYSECSQTCGGGLKRRWGKIIQQPQNGGAPCPALEQEQPCNTDINCVPGAVHCQVRYTKWTPCSKLCGGGNRQRWGEITQHPSAGGAPCRPLEETESCNVDPCPPQY